MKQRNKQQKRKVHSIRGQLAWIFIGLMIGTILLCLMINYLFLGKVYMQSKLNVIHDAYGTIKQAAESDSYDTEEFARELDDVCRSYNMTVCVMDVNSNMKYVSINGGERLENRLIGYVFGLSIPFNDQRVIENGDDYVIKRTGQEDKEYLEIYGRLNTGISFIMQTPLSSIQESAKIANRFYALAGCLGAMAGGIIIWFVSRSVTKPILEESNYSILIGKMKNLSIFDNLPINYRQSYIYCRGLIRQDDIRVDVEGKPVYELVDRGIWQEGEKYYFEARNEVTGRNEISTVYHRGSKWQCLKTGTLLEPKWNSTDWAFLEGNGEFSIDLESSNGFSFFYGLIDTVIEAKFYHGTVDITEDVMNTAGTQIAWSRDSGIPAEDNSWSPVFVDGQKNKVHLISSDMGSEWLNARSVTFRVEAIIPLGEENYLRESEELSFNL